MAWTAPATFTDGSILTAAQLNAMRDNFNETAPAKATGAGGFIATNGVNSVIQRNPGSDTVNTSETTTSTSFVDLATVGPRALSVVTDVRAIVWFTAQLNNSGAGNESIVGVAVSGATTAAADDNVSLDNQSATAFSDITACRATRFTVTAGTNNFTAKYRVTAGTGAFRRRQIVVIPV
ncbi:MAG: hypothetical protein QOH97_1304 [Actinoplanes sp.]|jgi:hypothetical protein|nr:hypothetical protein [Actinoplanes sp.]